VALLASEPVMLAHSSLATSDIAVSACLLALVYHFATNREAGPFRRIGLPALWLAAAVLCKASGLVFGPLCLVAVELERCLSQRTANIPLEADWRCRLGMRSPWMRRFLKDATCIVAGGLLLVILYCGGSEGSGRASLIAWCDHVPPGPVRTAAAWTTQHAPFPNNAVDGLYFQIQHNFKAGEGTYLLGNYYPAGQALWYYFPLALTMKLSLTSLGLMLLLAATRPRSLANWAMAAAAALLLFSLTCRVQIGVRYMLPLIALGTVGLAAAVVQSWQSFRAVWPKWLLAAAAGVGVAWSVAAAVVVWPNGLCYTNELWGGTERGYLCLSDSNYDWGQGLKELAIWHEQNGAPLDVCYFGSDPDIHKLGIRALTLEKMPLEGPDGMLTQIRGHFLAVSTTALYGHPASLTKCAAFLRQRQPVDRTSTFLIYDFTHEVEAAGLARGPLP